MIIICSRDNRLLYDATSGLRWFWKIWGEPFGPPGHSPYLLNWHSFVFVKFKVKSGKIECLERCSVEKKRLRRHTHMLHSLDSNKICGFEASRSTTIAVFRFKGKKLSRLPLFSFQPPFRPKPRAVRYQIKTQTVSWRYWMENRLDFGLRFTQWWQPLSRCWQQVSFTRRVLQSAGKRG